MIEILYFIPILLSSFCIGNFILKFFKLKTTYIEESIFSVVLGFAFYSYLTFFLGVLGWLYAWIYWAVILLSLILWHKSWIQFVKSAFETIKNFRFKFNLETFLIITIAIFAVLAILSTLVPPFLWDEMDYHLALPKIWARHHELIPIFSRWISELPSNVNMLYTIGIILKNGILSKFFALSYGLLLAAAIYSFGKRFYNQRAALLAASIYLSLPMIMNHIGSAYVDIPVASLAFPALYCFTIWIAQKNTKWLYLSSIFTGLSLASKHTAIFPAIVLGIFLIYYSIKNYGSRALKPIIVFGIIALIFVIPWYIKSYVRTGNPVWPLAYNIFGGKYWDSNLAAEFSKGLNIASDIGFLYFILLPWNITMHSYDFSLLLGWNAIFLAFVPLLIFYRKIEKTTLFLLMHFLVFLYSVVFASYYLFGLQLMRYILVYPALALISAAIIENFYRKNYFKKLFIPSLLITFSFTMLLWAGVFGQKMLYVFDIDNEAQYYNRLTDHNGYPVFSYINKNLPQNSIIFFFRESKGYLSDRDYIIGLPSDQKVVDYSKIKNEEDFYNQLKDNKVTHILINTKNEIYLPQDKVEKRQRPFSKYHQMLMDSLLNKYGEFLFEDKGVYLYKLK